ncbi:Na+/H+ antiporter NhaC family protein [Larsenimonas rhizosphaerae]|uniref:Transporter n=1 Tax=Larsenimonas rhizosphaerae TaxID=2944682 RepID=A0AA41ZHM2_9GAMM|nr:Na+/H+ antiporter NhaC family protein [Larsenimonas rhizosphaerae]MCM2131954.1 transporter [Larsenimonas rhizosphaerae]MCX2524740.1 transporter [Larsenimonas rhizosphaerae]
MDPQTHYGLLSLLPATLAIVLAFITRNTIFALAIACFVGVLSMGQGLMGFPTLLKTTLGTTEFSWILLLELFIGTVIAFFQRTGAIANFTRFVEQRALSRVKVQLVAWVMGMFVFFSDYFSPLFVGSTVRGLTDRYKVSRERLAYIADSTSAPVSVLVPITGWAVFISGLLIGMGPIETAPEAISVFVQAIPFNIYAWLSVLTVGLVIIGWVPSIGAMGRAEHRARTEGKVSRDGAQPLLGAELTDLQPFEGIKTSLWLNFVLPVLIVISVAIGTFIVMGSAKTMEAFLAAAVVLGVIMRLQGIALNDIISTALSGMKGVMPAIVILALAYSLNQLSKDMGTAGYIIDITRGWLTPQLLPAITFLVAALISFSTGSSWGTFAIMMPLSVPVAFTLTGDTLTPLVYATVAAVAGGGVFGDHCSPLSDTTVLASTGSACDHIDHVKTQIPFALGVASVTLVVYLGLGLTL